MNEIFFVCLLLISLLSVYLGYKFFGEKGLISLLATSNILSFILSFKIITLSTINLNANSFTYISMLTAIYLLLDKKDKKSVNKIINLNLIINIFTALILYIMSLYTQSLTDTVSINMTNVFYNNYQILIAFPISTFISQKILLLVYKKVKDIYDNIFISTTTTYMLVGLIEIIIFTLISYYSILDNKIIIKILLSTYMIRLIITVIYSIFLTLLNKKKVKK